MKHYLLALTLISGLLSSTTFANNAGLSVSIGEPGFYGRININDYPYLQPLLINKQPRVIERRFIQNEQIYLRVLPSHAKNWGKRCHQYNACNARVYFVQDSWYI
jgi:hypothetical protein